MLQEPNKYQFWELPLALVSISLAFLISSHVKLQFILVSVLTNVATEGVAEQSSTYFPIYEARHAIDGILLTDVFKNVSRAQCAITHKTEDESWWRVDLMKNTAVIGVVITTRKKTGKINSFIFPLNLLNVQSCNCI